MQDSKVDIASRDITANLPYIEGAHLVFDHHFQPGEMAVFDIHRILHARRSFNPNAGERWIQQLSVDREAFHSLFRQLAEYQQRFDLSHWEPDAGVLSQP